MAKKALRKPGAEAQRVDVPPPAVVDDEHTQLVRWVKSSDEGTDTARKLSEQCRGYYDGMQWTDAEQSKLRLNKQATTVFNRIKPKMDGLMGMERANRTTAKAFPRTPKHAAGATAATEAVRFVLQDNFYEQHRSEAWENLLIEGSGGLEIIADGKGEDVNLRINHIMWDRLIYDPHSRRKDFTDARYLGQYIWMDYDDAVELHPRAKDVLEAMFEGSLTFADKPSWMDSGRRRVKIVELYYYKGSEVYYSCFTGGGFIKQPKISPYKNENGETEWPYEFASLFVEREGVRYGACRQYLDVQDEINKRRSKAMHLMSVRQIAVFKGAVDDVNVLRRELAKPDGVVELNQPIAESFEILKTNDMAAAQFNLLTEAKMEIDAVGYNAAASGKDSRAISGVALRQRTQASQTELAPMFDVLKHLDIRVYRKVWNRIKQYWKEEKWIRVTDDENNLKWVGLNKPITKGEEMLKQAQAQGAPPEILQQLAQRIEADPTMKDQATTDNDIAQLDVDIVMDEAPDTVTQEVEDFQAMAEIVKSRPDFPLEALIISSPLSNKDKIIKMMKERPQIPPELQKKLEQMQEGIQQLTQENQALKSDKQTEVQKLQLEAQGDQQKREADREKTQAELALKREIQAAELALERERAQATIELERLKAEAQLELQGVKIQGDQQAQTSKLVFDQECRLKEEQEKRAEQAKADEEPLVQNLFPKVMETMQDMLKMFAESLKQSQDAQSKMNAALVEALNRPKTVALGNIRRNDDGITGATATVN